MNIKSLVAAVVIATASITTAQAAQFITGYDITNATTAWDDPSYSGAITLASGGPFNGLFNYTGGNGILNDGVVDAGVRSSQRFTIDDTSITLHLNSPTFLSELNIFGGSNSSSNLAGALTGATISFAGQSLAFSSTPWGPACYNGLCNDRFSFAGTGLANIATSSITLSNFQGGAWDYNFWGYNGWGYSRYFSATEISISGVAAVSPVPEAETYAMLLAGLGLMGGMARRRKQKLATA